MCSRACPVRRSSSEVLGEDMALHAIRLHMHLRGKSCEAVAYLPDGTSQSLLSVPNYDFYWQRTYWYAQPKELPAGTRIETRLLWDNSAANQQTVDGKKLEPQDVYWGEGTQDEMCLGIFLVSELP